MASKTQSGFSAVIGVAAVVLIIGTLGFISWKLYIPPNECQPSKETNDTTSNCQNTNQNPINSNQGFSPIQQADPNADYTVIRQWGVRFKPVIDLSDVKYSVLDNNTIDFTTQQLDELDPNCNGQEFSFTVLGSVFRSTNALIPGASSLGKVGGYYYYYSDPEGTCSNDTNTKNIETTATANLKASLSTLEPTQ